MSIYFHYRPQKGKFKSISALIAVLMARTLMPSSKWPIKPFWFMISQNCNYICEMRNRMTGSLIPPSEKPLEWCSQIDSYPIPAPNSLFLTLCTSIMEFNIEKYPNNGWYGIQGHNLITLLRETLSYRGKALIWGDSTGIGEICFFMTQWVNVSAVAFRSW